MADAPHLSPRVQGQIAKAGLPTTGTVPFVPSLGVDSRNRQRLRQIPISHGPKVGEFGYLDTAGRIWRRDRAHAHVPDYWDVQEDGGKTYFRVDDQGNII